MPFGCESYVDRPSITMDAKTLAMVTNAFRL